MHLVNRFAKVGREGEGLALDLRGGGGERRKKVEGNLPLINITILGAIVPNQ